MRNTAGVYYSLEMPFRELYGVLLHSNQGLIFNGYDRAT
jgi:hypothetical protein